MSVDAITLEIIELKDLLEEAVSCDWNPACDSKATHFVRHDSCVTVFCTPHVGEIVNFMRNRMMLGKKHFSCGHCMTYNIPEAEFRIEPL